jgi:anti-sigma B factor antagonist
MEITVIERPHSRATVVALHDELDIASAPRLHAVFADLLGRSVVHIVVDLSAVTFCDSIGLSALAVTHNACLAAGGYLCVANPSPALLRILTVAGLRGRLPIYASVEAACADDPAGLVTADDGEQRLPADRQ